MSRMAYFWEIVLGWLPQRPGKSGLANVLKNNLELIVASILLSSIATSGVWNHNLTRMSSSAQKAASLLNDQIEQSFTQIEDQDIRIKELLNHSMKLEGDITALESELSLRQVETVALEKRLEESLEVNSDLKKEIFELKIGIQEKAEKIEGLEGRTLLASRLWEEVHGTYIVTSESGISPTQTRMRVWVHSGTEYVSIWSTEGVFYDNVEIGDVDNDGATKEIVASRRSRVKGTGPHKQLYEVILDVYKEGTDGVWMVSESVVERWGFANEIEIADVDGEPGNEVVLKTDEWLVVHKYFQDENVFKIISSRNIFLNGEKFDLQSLAVGDIDADGENEILVGADLDGMETNEGYLLVFEDASLEDYWSIAFEKMPCSEDLMVGNLDDDQDLEICCVFYEILYGDVDQAYLVILDREGESWVTVVEEPMGEPNFHPGVKLAIGELISDNEGEEIVITTMDPDTITVYSLKEADTFSLHSEVSMLLGYYIVQIGNVNIADVDSDGLNELIASGYGKSDRRSGRFYMEVFDSSLSSEWRRLGGVKTEGEAWGASVG